VASRLEAAGLDVSAPDASMRTGLHLAVQTRKGCAVIEHLLGRGLDPNACDADGHTPLHLALSDSDEGAGRRSLEAAELLVSAGACVDAYDGWAALEQACPGATERLRRTARWARRRSWVLFLSGLHLLSESSDGRGGSTAAPQPEQAGAGGRGGALTVRGIARRGGRARGDVLGEALWNAHRHIASYL
jgi:hypothetical protein